MYISTLFTSSHNRVFSRLHSQKKNKDVLSSYVLDVVFSSKLAVEKTRFGKSTLSALYFPTFTSFSIIAICWQSTLFDQSIYITYYHNKSYQVVTTSKKLSRIPCGNILVNTTWRILINPNSSTEQKFLQPQTHTTNAGYSFFIEILILIRTGYLKHHLLRLRSFQDLRIMMTLQTVQTASPSDLLSHST